tara:strand:+ start:1718 stop:2203 length:486 start_codon:yes stop_codon:yes gene_type:complete
MINISEKLKGIKILAKKKDLILSTAESCTGGLIAKYLTDLPGSSEFYDSSFITYSNSSKSLLLDVKNELIETHGAVSKEVVIEMCKGLLLKNKANLGVSVSGIMGPSSDNTSKKIGLVWACFNYKDQIKAYQFELTGSRSENREAAAKTVIINLYDFINEL